MILVDTCALYALNDLKDMHHNAASTWYSSMKDSNETFAITQMIMVESWFLVQRRKNHFFADRLWELMTGGIFHVLEPEAADLAQALEIRKKYSDSGMSIVDATSLQACERFRIEKVFTFDYMHFSMYKPGFTERLTILPEP